ncbi:MAG TPA: acyl-CoA thioesterase/bile acid-CoA:amino acid N-acyltransferase family protein [Solirubrobacteraceae bacterium]|nr:acyl-CoA thioesterase/bile acid-CoA:amino acid N-acyltransferase family protein [Solirubrobacteraceae bacterium]
MKTGGTRLWAVLVASIAAGALAGCGGQHLQHGQVAVAPAFSLFDQPVHIVVSSVGSHRNVVVQLTSVDEKGHEFASRATFRSNGSGRVDLASTPATGGSYSGVDPMGLIDALQTASGQSSSYFWSRQHPGRFRIIVTEDGSKVASGGFSRRGYLPGVTVSNESIAATGFYGQFWRPRPGNPRRPGVLEFGGSEGGLDGQLLGAGLASAGFPTLNIAYFGEPGLPSELSDIPLEYFARALRWLARQPEVVAGQIYVSGVSRGSEAALLLGVHYPKLVHGVIASSPSDLSFGSYPDRGSAAWTYAGKPVPHSLSFSPDIPVLDPAAEIHVEQIHGPVLLDCGTDDQIWTSCAYAQAIQNRLSAAHDRFPHVLFRYRGAGHFVGVLIPYEPGLALVAARDQGDTPLANLNSDARLWPHLLSFLTNPAGQAGTFSAPATPPPLTTS